MADTRVGIDVLRVCGGHSRVIITAMMLEVKYKRCYHLYRIHALFLCSSCIISSHFSLLFFAFIFLFSRYSMLYTPPGVDYSNYPPHKFPSVFSLLFFFGASFGISL